MTSPKLRNEPEVISLLSSDEEEDDTRTDKKRRPHISSQDHHVPQQRQLSPRRKHDPKVEKDGFVDVYTSGKSLSLRPDQTGNCTSSAYCVSSDDDEVSEDTDDNYVSSGKPSQLTCAIDSKPLTATEKKLFDVDDPNMHSRHQDRELEEKYRPQIPVKEPPLCPEQTELVDIILSGRNVFYTGSAGCGKSTVLKAFTKRLRERGLKVDIVAPTGISALAVGGSTTFVYAGWNLNSFKQPLAKVRAGAHGIYIRKRLKETDVLVIDEISMVENFHFERLNAVMQEARSSYEPFGGVQVIVTGDFHQLPPVKPFEFCLQCGQELAANRSEDKYSCKKHGVFHDEDKWAFKSEAWAMCNFVYFHLRTIHRQNDETFIKILQKCRIGQPLTGEDTDILMNHPSKTGNATKLYARRDEVRRENKIRFDKLLSEKFSYPCLDEADLHPDHNNLEKHTWRAQDGTLSSLKDHRFEPFVEFKKGMLVVLLTNLDLSMKLCNGSQGLICGYEEYDKKKLPRVPSKKDKLAMAFIENAIHGDYAELREKYIRMFMDRKEVTKKFWPIVRFHNGVVRTIYADCSVHTLGNKEPYSLISRTQIPLAPAWAMSIHKSQSLTLDRVIVDLTRAWEEGQVYVALSRATNLEGLKIEGDPRGLTVGKGGNTEVRKFHREKFGI